MRGGNISNDIAPAIGFRFERLIKTEEGKLNRHVKGYIEQVIGDLDLNVYIITTNGQRKALSFCYKWGIPYTRIIQADSLLEIPEIVNENSLLTYYDLDLDVVQNVNSRGRKGVKAELWMHPEVL